ncbi:hypothetical protein CROQUDRAFT_661540 [Cronartium quercuum f. sp. fusiforme G11]|uniref:SUZ domain-containing protein n=1 Tax=Cronartium quercuum f. sp. fusiforme G11 TaxID=708437 RepID=A0A9P6NCT7_9BASI|nr:hypothetical protein CROQUDRAFT_661540 [Cronartium quercuum f. sp. fusiforme G11]
MNGGNHEHQSSVPADNSNENSEPPLAPIKSNPSPYTLLRRQASSPTHCNSSQPKLTDSQPSIKNILLNGTSSNDTTATTTSDTALEDPSSLSTSNADQNHHLSKTFAPTQTLPGNEASHEVSPTSLGGTVRRTDQLDTTVVEAMMTGTVRDKQILLQAEAEMGRFVSSTQLRQPVGSALSTSLNSYQRMLVHRLGDSFGIKRSMEMGHMFMERTPHSAWPTIRLESFIVRQDASPSNIPPFAPQTNYSTPIAGPGEGMVPPVTSQNPDEANAGGATTSTVPLKTFKIMSRTPSQRSSSRQTNTKAFTASSASSVSSADANNSDSKRNELSYEARQAAYLQARNRIFASEAAEGIDNSPAQAGADITAKDAPDSDAKTTPNIINEASGEDAGLSASSNGKDDPSNDASGGARDAGMANKGKERMAATLRSAKLAAKLRPSATTFDPHAKAHGYEEVTIIDFDEGHVPMPWPGYDGYAYPSDHITRQFQHPRQSRSTQLYGDGYSSIPPAQHFSPHGTQKSDHRVHTVSYPTFPPSNGQQMPYIHSRPPPHQGSGTGAPYQPLLPHSLSGPASPAADLAGQPFLQDSGPQGSYPSNLNARFNTNPSTQATQRGPGQHTRFHEVPTSLYGANGIPHMISNDPMGIPGMNGAQASMPPESTVSGRPVRPQFEQTSNPPRSADTRASSAHAVLQSKPGFQGASAPQLSPDAHQSVKYSQTVPYPSHQPMPQGTNLLPSQHHMNQYHGHPQANHPSPFDNNPHQTTLPGPPNATWPQPSAPPQLFQPPLHLSTVNQSIAHDTDQSSATSPRHSLHLPPYVNHQHNLWSNSQPSYQLNPPVLPDSHREFSPMDSRVQTHSAAGLQAPQLPYPIGSTNHNSIQSMQRIYDPTHPHQSSSSKSSSSTESSHRTTASTLSRSMNNMKLAGSNDLKLVRQNSRPINTRIIATDNANRYPRSPASVGSSTSSHRLPLSKKQGTSSDGIGQDEAGSIKSSRSESESKPSNHNSDTLSSVDASPRPSSSKTLSSVSSLAPTHAHQTTELALGEADRKAKHSGSANSTTSSDALSTNSSEPPHPALQHPLPPKPLWAVPGKVQSKSSRKSSSSSTNWTVNQPSGHYHPSAPCPPQPVSLQNSENQPTQHYNGDQSRGFAKEDANHQQNVYPHAFQQNAGYGQQPPPAQMIWNPPSNLTHTGLPTNGYQFNNLYSDGCGTNSTAQFNGSYSPEKTSNSVQPREAWAAQVQCRTNVKE